MDVNLDHVIRDLEREPQDPTQPQHFSPYSYQELTNVDSCYGAYTLQVFWTITMYSWKTNTKYFQYPMFD